MILTLPLISSPVDDPNVDNKRDLQNIIYFRVEIINNLFGTLFYRIQFFH